MTSNKTYFYAALFLIGLVISFAVLSAQPNPTPDLYRFSVLRLTKGTIVTTADGKYIALKDERWFSEVQCMALQKENAALQFALNQSRHLRQ